MCADMHICVKFQFDIYYIKGAKLFHYPLHCLVSTSACLVCSPIWILYVLHQHPHDYAPTVCTMEGHFDAQLITRAQLLWRLDKTEENLPITLLKLCGMEQPPDEERGPVEPSMGERTIDDEFNYLAEEIDTVMGHFLWLQTTMTIALKRYQCLLLNAWESGACNRTSWVWLSANGLYILSAKSRTCA